MTNFGLSQISSLPPKWWRRLERALLIGVVPAATTFVTQMINDAATEVHYLTIIGFATALIKSFGVFLGSGEEYPKESEEKSDLHIVKDHHE